MEVVFFEIKMGVYGRYRLLLGKLRYAVELPLFIKVNGSHLNHKIIILSVLKLIDICNETNWTPMRSCPKEPAKLWLSRNIALFVYNRSFFYL